MAQNNPSYLKPLFDYTVWLLNPRGTRLNSNNFTYSVFPMENASSQRLWMSGHQDTHQILQASEIISATPVYRSGPVIAQRCRSVLASDSKRIWKANVPQSAITASSRDGLALGC